jgi:hypothetical protein
MGSYGFLRATVVPWKEQFRITMMMTTVVMMSVMVTMIMLWAMMMRMVAATMVKMTAGLRLALSGLTIRAGNSRAPPQAQGVLHVQPMA